MTKLIGSCSKCRYFNEHSGHGGFCHRYPPEIIATTLPDGYGGTTPSIENHLPFVGHSYVCGEFKS